MRAVRLPLLVLVSALVAAACGATTGGATPAASAQSPTRVPSDPSSPGASGAATADPSAFAAIADPTVLVGRTFLSTDSLGHDLVPGSRVRLAFQDGSRLGVSAGCNSMGGPYAITDSTLHVTGPMMQTEMACEAPLMAQDAWIAAFIDGATMTSDGTGVLLVNDGDTLTLMDEAIANPDRPLEGTTWVVESLIRDQAASSVPAGLTATLVFGDGRVAASTGCNRGNGPATVAADAITFGPMALTRMACPQPAMDLEAFVTGVLQGEVAYSIDADVLHLLGAGGALDLRAQRP